MWELEGNRVIPINQLDGNGLDPAAHEAGSCSTILAVGVCVASAGTVAQTSPARVSSPLAVFAFPSFPSFSATRKKYPRGPF